MVALGVGLDLFGKSSPALDSGYDGLSEVKDELSSGVSVSISKGLSHIISSTSGGVSPELTELECILEDSFNSSLVNGNSDG